MFRNFFLGCSLCIILAGWLIPAQIAAQPQQKGIGTITTEPQTDSHRTWALIYGINYSGRKSPSPLRYGVSDALLFKSFLVSPAGGSVPESHIIMRLDSQATAAWPYYDFKKLKDSVRQGDKVYVYFSGHGISSGPNKSYLLLYDAPKVEDPGQFGNMGGVLNTGDLKDDIGELAAKADVYLIVDACRNNEKKDAAQSNIQSKLLLNSNPPHVILLSCGTNQSSIEDTVWGGGHGVFTYYLVKGLEGMADQEATGRDHATGTVTFEKLEEYLRKHVKEDTYDYDGGQKPVVDYMRKYNGDQKVADVYPEILAKWQKNGSEEKYMASIAAKKNFDNADTDLPELYTRFEEALKQGKNVPGENGNAQSFLDSLMGQGKYPDLAAQAQQELIVSLINDGQRVINYYLEGFNGSNSIPTVYVNYNPLYPPKDIFSIGSDKMLDALTRMDHSHPYFDHYKVRQLFLYARHLSNFSENRANIDSALTILKALVLEDSSLAYVYHALGRIYYYENKDLEGSLKMEKKALTLAPKWTTALNVVGDNYSYQKTYDSARIYFQKALDIDSNNYGALIGMGTVYYMENNFSKAFTYYEKILNFVKRNGKTIDPWLLERLGTILKKLRRYPEAISIYESGLKIDTSDDWVFYDIVAVYALWNKPQEALQNLEEALQQGFKDWDRLNEDTDLDNIRNLPEFKALLEKYRAINK